MKRALEIADINFLFKGKMLSQFIDSMSFFAPFVKTEGSFSYDFSIIELDRRMLGKKKSTDIENLICTKDSICPKEPIYRVVLDGLVSEFYRTCKTIFFKMSLNQVSDVSNVENANICHDTLWEWWDIGSDEVYLVEGNYSARMLRYAVWIAINFLSSKKQCFAVHSSANVFHNRDAVIYLGESGTGKSTHTRLLRETYHDSFLLNDDSPFVRCFEDGRVIVYGSPWSGKTDCYKSISFQLRAIVRLSQAPYNEIEELSPLASIAALLPSLPPFMHRMGELCSNHVYEFLSKAISAVPVFSLRCLPDVDAARLSYSTVFNMGNKYCRK